ncbi:hypothetical protein ACE1OE_19955 [Vibrio sp. E150_011]
MAQHYTDKEIDIVVGLLDGWEGKLSWSLLCEQAQIALNREVVTRQTLSSFPRVKDAFADMKGRGLGSGKWQPKNGPRPQSLEKATKTIIRLTDENERLKREARALLEQFAVWQYNAFRLRISGAELNKPLPAIDRETTRDED